MIKNSDNICFYFPYKEDSGVPILFARMANELAETYPEKNIYVIDYIDGAIARNIIKIKNITLIQYQDGVDVIPPEDAVLVQQSDVAYYWPSNLILKDETKLYFWNLHPRNFVPSLLPFPLVRELPFNKFYIYKALSLLYPKLLGNISYYVNLLLKHKALSFMDSTNYNTTKKYISVGDFRHEYLPVPASAPNKRGKVRTENNLSTFNYCWIGRICDFKAYILSYTIKKLAETALNNEIKIHYFIIGDGPLTTYVEQNISENAFFTVEFCGALPHNEIDDFLLEKVDVVTAMGTSALESAKLSIPTILLDVSYRVIKKDYIFRWLYNTKDFDLGHIISDQDFDNNNNSLKDIVLSIAANYTLEANKSYQYFEQNHTINRVTDRFLNFVDQSSLTYGMIDKRCFEKPFLLHYYNKLRRLN